MNLPLTRMNQHTRPRYRRAGTALAALCVPALAAAGMLGGITSESAEAATAPTPACTTPTLTHWEEGTQHGPWNVVYDGYGTVHGGGDVVTLSPKVAREPGVTHGGLVATRRHYGPNIDVTATWRTHKQLRTGSAPNPWESGWLLWHYTDDLHFYALALKPNGWELSKEDPAYPGAQRYLRTGNTPKFPVGSTNTARVVQQGPRIDVWVNGTKLTSFTDRERPYTRGSVGLYTEDAAVTFTDVRRFGKPVRR